MPLVAGVDAREGVVLEVEGPRSFAPLENAFAKDTGLCAPQAVAVAAGALILGPAPRAGNASSDFILSVDCAGGFSTFRVKSASSFAFCFPAAFADIDSVADTGC